MAFMISRGVRGASRRTYSLATASASRQSDSESWLFPAAIGGLCLGALTIGSKVYADEEGLIPAKLPWPHHGVLGAYDTASLRRGFEVYRNVCSTCHSISLISFRNLVGVTHTEAQAKALAASYKVRDGPNEKGEYFERPGTLPDPIPKPYENEGQAREANNGALPPDLSLVVKAREFEDDYIFALLTGYREPPHGVQLRDGLFYNPYFPGGSIGMRQALQNGGIEFEDGTLPTVSQQAKDVSAFLHWAAEPKQDERKKFGFRVLGTLLLMVAGAAYYKRFRWNIWKSRRVTYLE